MLSIQTFLAYLLPFAFLLTLLVFIHELGHFAVARFFGIWVETFSIGFGPKLFKKKWGETDFCLSILPFGGYVKMYGDNPSATIDSKLSSQAFLTQKPYVKMCVVLAGPLANLFLALFIWLLILLGGENYPSPQIGLVLPASYAEQIGLRSFDTIRKVDGQTITTRDQWEDLLKPLSIQQVTQQTWQVQHADLSLQTILVNITPQLKENMLGERVVQPWVQGLDSSFLGTRIMVLDPKSEAAQSGFKSGDVITQVAHQELKHWGSWLTLKNLFSDQHTQAAIPIEVLRLASANSPKLEKPQTVKINVSPKIWNQLKLFLQSEAQPDLKQWTQALRKWGLYQDDLEVENVVAQSAASKAGVQAGDYILSIAGKPLYSFNQFRNEVQEWGERFGNIAQENKNVALELTLLRNGSTPITVSVRPEIKTITQEGGLSQTMYLVGISKRIFAGEMAPVFYRETNLFKAAHKALSSVWEMIELTLKGFYWIFAGRVSTDAIGGPLTMAKFAGETYKISAVIFFKLVSMISINLFVLNLLPIPVLDGGHLVLFIIEAIRRKPLPTMWLERITIAGVTFVLSLTVLSLFNDALKFIWPILKNLLSLAG